MQCIQWRHFCENQAKELLFLCQNTYILHNQFKMFKKTIPAMWNLLLVCTVFNELINKNFKIQGFYWFMSYDFRIIYYWIMNEYKYWLIIVSVFVFSIWTIAQGRTLFFLTGPVLNIFMFLSIVYLILCNCTMYIWPKVFKVRQF